MSVGAIAYANELDRRCDNLTGMEYVKSRLTSLNYAHGICQSPQWPMINRMLWRFDAMYNGGDWFCCSKNLTAYRPHERLWTMRRTLNSRKYGYRKVHIDIDTLKDEARKLHNRRHGG